MVRTMGSYHVYRNESNIMGDVWRLMKSYKKHLMEVNGVVTHYQVEDATVKRGELYVEVIGLRC